jgi:hypothetical protein
MSSKSQTVSSVVLSVNDWKPGAIMFPPHKTNDKGGKSVNIISTQTKRAIHISTPLMMTWGINDFVDPASGESDGKYKISLNFPNDDYKTEQTTLFLNKLKEFENHILDEAVKNCEEWWGEQIPRDILKYNFNPILKYSKNKETKKIDYTRPPSISAKVPLYRENWGVELWDTQMKKIFPCEDPTRTPMDFVPKMSNIACVLQCGGIWIGGKGWGLSWKLVQCVVKPRVIQSVYGKCHIKLSDEDRNIMTSQQITEEDDNSSQANVVTESSAPISTMVSDDEEDDPPAPAVVKEPVPPAVVQETEQLDVPVIKPPPAAPVKKVIKKRT